MTAMLYAALGAVLMVGCDDKPRASELKGCDTNWTPLNGTMESVAPECSKFVGTSAEGAAGERYWLGHFELKQQPKTTTMDLRATVSRPKADEVYPIELSFLGGHFGAAQGRYFFWESDDQWSGWQDASVPFTQPLRLRVRQRGTHVEGFVNDALVGTYTMKSPPRVGPVAVFFKSAKGQAAKVQVADVVLSEP